MCSAKTTAGAGLDTRLTHEIELGRLTLPVMPDIAARVREEAARPTSSAKNLAQIISSDAALAARILKMANSAIYAGLSEIKDLDRAIGRLGSAMVVALVVGAAGKETFRSKDPKFNTLAALAWRRSIHASAAARRLALELSMRPEEAFLAGLLHAAGEPVLLELVRMLMDSGAIERPTDDQIVDSLEQLAPLAGARLLAKWSLPDEICQVVEHQLNPSRAPDSAQPGAWLLALTGIYARDVVSGAAGTDSRFPAAVEALGLLPEQVLDLLEQASGEARIFAASL